MRLPSDPQKRYLSGIDWLIQALDHLTRRATGVGNVSQIVVELDRALSGEALEYLGSLGTTFPVLAGRTRRDYNLAPYWQGTDAFSIQRLPVQSGISNDDSLIDAAVNRDWSGQREHLAFAYETGAERSRIGMKFDHRLFDARGAEAFMGLIQEGWKHRDEPPARSEIEPSPARLDDWSSKFRAGRRTNQAFQWLGQNAPPIHLALPSDLKGRPFRFRHACFDEGQSKRIVENAYNQAGYLLLMPFVLAASLSAFHRIFLSRQAPGGDYVVSVTVDTRPQETVMKEIFFNHLSFLHFRVSQDEACDFKKLLAVIRKQLYEMVKSDFSATLKETAYLMRIFPLPLLSRMMGFHFKGEIASFCFSYVGESAYTRDEFLGAHVRNIIHTPRVPVPPGLGLFFTQHRGRLNAVLTYVEGIFEERDADEIMSSLATTLGVQ